MDSLAQLTSRLYTGTTRTKTHTNTFYSVEPDPETLAARPWRNSPKYFTRVFVSAVALLKMSVHAKVGGSIEVMGMLTGKIVRDMFIVMDVYSLPVEGTETRVNAQSEAYEYMVQYLDLLKAVDRKDGIVGWYHSHPGYGCWLSGIDVATQSLNQSFQDPYLAIVVDPAQTLLQNKVEIGAFRAFPVGYDPERKSGPAADTGRDFGVHRDQYYALDINLFVGERHAAVMHRLQQTSWNTALSHTSATRLEYGRSLAQKIGRMQHLHDPLALVRRDWRMLEVRFELLMGQHSSHCLPSSHIRSVAREYFDFHGGEDRHGAHTDGPEELDENDENDPEPWEERDERHVQDASCTEARGGKVAPESDPELSRRMQELRQQIQQRRRDASQIGHAELLHEACRRRRLAVFGVQHVRRT